MLHSDYSTGENVLFTKSSKSRKEKEQVRVHYVRVAGQQRAQMAQMAPWSVHDAIEGD